MGAPKLRVSVAIPELGAPSQPWVYRQLDFMNTVDPQIIYWKRGALADHFSQRFNSLHLNGHVKPIIRTDAGRWAQRLANGMGGNYLAPDKKTLNYITNVIAYHRPDVILAHFGHTALYLLRVAEKLGINIVVHFHGLDLSESFINNRWYRWSLTHCLNKFQDCIVVGSHQRRLLIEHGLPPERVHLIPCGVPTECFQPAQIRTDRPFRFAIVARLVKSKGVDVSIRAFARMLDKQPDAELVIVGDGPERAALEALSTSLSLGKKVCFLGAIDQNGVTRVLRDSNALLQHSLESNGWVEGFGVSVAEASACSLPVIVSRSGGLIDQVIDGDTGFIVPIGDENRMADVMQKLSENHVLARQLGEAGRRRMVEKFDSRLLAGRLCDVLGDAARHPAKHKHFQRISL